MNCAARSLAHAGRQVGPVGRVVAQPLEVVRRQLPRPIGPVTGRLDVLAALGRRQVSPVARRLAAPRRVYRQGKRSGHARHPPGTRMYMINQATGAATSRESRRSITPPCPGRKELMSLIPTSRLIIDSIRSPQVPTATSAHAEDDAHPERHLKHEDGHHHREADAEDHRAGEPLPRLLGTDLRSHRMLAEQHTADQARRCRSWSPPARRSPAGRRPAPRPASALRTSRASGRTR